MEIHMEIYVHIPFCLRKCRYCDFLSFPCGGKERARYLSALGQEIACCGRGRAEGAVTSIYFGGGTPSLLSDEQMGYLMGCVKRQFSLTPDAEITMEANPGTLTASRLAGYRRAGINRLSIGCQSVHDSELSALGRIHRYGDFRESYHMAREAGFANINVDLMYGLPGQTAASWRQSLETVCALGPEHVSAYSLIVEAGTPFADMDLDLPDEDAERQMAADAVEILADHGYTRYEISNFARPGFTCCHNIGYWDGTPYISFGLGASSYMGQTRWRNTRSMENYLKNVSSPACLRRDVEILTIENRMEEFMFLGLRMTAGVSRSEFAKRFGVSMNEVYGEKIEHFVREKLLTNSGDRVFLTERGLDLANVVMAEFLLG
ncbi:MAG TPA: oxygen-independent coproporphyrinogen III oxidase [Lachnospiraceae bacterium]|nr:oxygen-independent coproporphyrinogen III oxidase [Lachnospiraceae bacterium]